MKKWQSLMLKGNNRFNLHQWGAAEQCYQGAILLLEQTFINSALDAESVLGWICGYHNLATLFSQQGLFKEAQKCLLIPHHSMLYLAQKGKAKDQQALAISALKITLTPLLDFAQKHPTCDSCYDHLVAQYQHAHQSSATLH